MPTSRLSCNGSQVMHSAAAPASMRYFSCMVPFDITIPQHKQDKMLTEKLRSEWPGILQWAIDGCLIWQMCELSPPAAIRDATEEYLRSQDLLAQWIDDCCGTGPGLQQPRS